MTKKQIYYLIINVNTFKMRLCTSKSAVATIVGVHRNTLKNINAEKRDVFNGFIVTAIELERIHRTKTKK